MRHFVTMAALLVFAAGCSGATTSSRNMPPPHFPSTVDITRRAMAARGLPPGTRIYASDAVTIENATTVFVVGDHSSVKQLPSGQIVFTDAKGKSRTFSSDFVIKRHPNEKLTAILPGKPIPIQFQHAKPVEVIK